MLVGKISRCAGNTGGGLAPPKNPPPQPTTPTKGDRNLEILRINLEIWEKGPRKKTWIQP